MRGALSNASVIHYSVAFGFLAHPLMLRAIAAAKKKNDRIDAGKIADCLRCDVRHRRTILRISAGIP